MWFVRVKDEEVVYFLYEKRPEYAILSHRWDGEHPEVSFQDMQDRQKATGMHNYQKIRQTCKAAATRGLEYVWIDTCCINKESSAELTEAINSMFRWYQNAALCYAYLPDLVCESGDDDLHSAVSESQWFERGWTLQELIAPKEVHFLNKHWNTIGTKSSLATILAERTGIDIEVLTGLERHTSRSVAQRMSWASSRETTRVEDAAYCLLGIFDINMPLLYGEGEKAFLRLQEEIIRSSCDHSIFAWAITEQHSIQTDPNISTSADSRRPLHGLLADSPAAFKNCGNVKEKRVRGNRSAYTITNRGLSITLYAAPIAADTFMAMLECDDDTAEMQKDIVQDTTIPCLMIFVIRLDEDGQFARVSLGPNKSMIRGDSYVADPPETGPLYQKLRMSIPVQTARLLDYEDSEARRIRIANIQVRDGHFGVWTPTKLSRNWEGQRTEEGLVVYTPDYYNDICPNLDGPLVLSSNKSAEMTASFLTIRFDGEGLPVCLIQDYDMFMSGPLLCRETLPNETDLRFWSRLIKRGYGNRDNAIQSAAYKGFWALKTDFADGIDTTLSVDSTTPIGRLSVKRCIVEEEGPTKGMYVWEIACEMWLTGWREKVQDFNDKIVEVWDKIKGS